MALIHEIKNAKRSRDTAPLKRYRGIACRINTVVFLNIFFHPVPLHHLTEYLGPLLLSRGYLSILSIFALFSDMKDA